MRHSRLVLVAVVGWLLAAGSLSRPVEAADTGETSGAAIIVRTYAPSHLGGELGHARRAAGAILEDARIQIEWVDCGDAAAGAPEACRQPLQSHEFVVRVVSAGRPGSPADALGFAFVDRHAGGGSLATVFADRVRALAKGTGVSAAELLGRTIAHEIGHLLLGSNAHAPSGLMRASWSSADLRRDRSSRWLFTGTEGEMMRQGLARRIRPTDALALAYAGAESIRNRAWFRPE